MCNSNRPAPGPTLLAQQDRKIPIFVNCWGPLRKRNHQRPAILWKEKGNRYDFDVICSYKKPLNSNDL